MNSPYARAQADDRDEARILRTLAERGRRRLNLDLVHARLGDQRPAPSLTAP